VTICNQNVKSVKIFIKIGQDTWLLSVVAAFTALDLELKFLIIIKLDRIGRRKCLKMLTSV
jgi:hypothetical protein